MNGDALKNIGLLVRQERSPSAGQWLGLLGNSTDDGTYTGSDDSELMLDCECRYDR